MKVLKILLITVVSLVAIFFLVGMFLPKTYSVQRSAVINASDSTIFVNISDFNAFLKWNPWAKMDPGAQFDVFGTPQTVGHTYQWNGKKTGKGQMKITSLSPDTAVSIELRFIEPMENIADTRFNLQKEGNGQKVTWSMHGVNNNTMDKWMSLFMDKMVGKDFEEGLKNLKEKSEGK